MEKIARFTAEERDNLTAYLDGELDESSATKIEQKLTRSEVARREVEILERTWEMLSLLPRASASGEFSQKTLAIARQEEIPFADRAANLVKVGRRIGVLSAWSIVLLIVAIFGYQLTNNWIPDQSRQLVEELPLIENLDNYREVGDVDFLKQLRASPAFRKDERNAPVPE